ncbi:M23 family metallopeptidase [Nocardia sp. NPDC052566]|uniref:M23 family metallopeptidase n=1 Tax=Nocardia sp. NPDC052566 TaxID=3364330 RepID=UPI0037CCAE98
MNHRSAFVPENRSRSHRYRDDEESYGANGHSGGQRDVGDSGYAPASVSFASFNPEDSWDGFAQGDSWTANDDSWAPEPAQGSWAPQAQNTWAADQAQGSYKARGAWTPDRGQSDSWSANEAWGQDDSWPEGGAWSEGGAWDSEQSWADDEDAETPAATPTVVPARRANRRGGAHRVPTPPAALKGRAAVVAVAAGAVVAAGQAAIASPGEQQSHSIDYQAAGQVHEIAAQSVSVTEPGAANPESPQVLNVSAPTNLNQFNDILEKGRKYAEDLAAQEAAKLRPLFTKFTSGNFTSGYGARWGVQHLGIDVAGPIGTPIVAVADGTVLEAGPAAGFGMWVRLLHDDGTVTIYGHIDTATVSQGQRVMAGDQIATIGNRGFSTGPHCHFEVWLNGTDKIDPVPWLATRGIGLGPQRD